MVKLILCMAIVCSGALIGVYYSRRLYRRRDTISDFLSLFHTASIRLDYTGADLCEAFRDNFAGFDFIYDESFDAQWHAFISSFRYILTADDYRLLTDFVTQIGASDIDSQRRHIELYTRLLSEQLEQARAEAEKKSKLWQVLPLSAGLVIALLLI